MTTREEEENTGYVGRLRKLVVDQIDKFISKVLKDEYTVDNGDAPAGQTKGTGRIGQLMDISNPRLESPSTKDGTTKLYILPEDVELTHPNNNPEYPSNLIHRLNTPFDHIERILLQDFSGVMDIEGEGNYFKRLFSFTPIPNTYGFNGIQLSGDGVEYGCANGALSENNGGFFVDSFTYTPFIDYSQVGEGGDSRTGVYSDDFLNDYNLGRYDDKDVPSDSEWHQYDANRRKMTSCMYKMGNLEKDLYDAKIAFRDAITYVDDDGEQTRKVYMQVFAQHLATLFAKLSNIRMCHEFYGFKAPHHAWEGILALDIWYQMLYKAVDCSYPFNDSYLNMNPMLRKRVLKDDNDEEYVQLDTGDKVYRHDVSRLNLEWIEDETDSDYAFLWDQGLWGEYASNSEDIAKFRKECVTPRGVLKKIHDIVTSSIPEQNILNCAGGDFDWFKQKGKVYSDSDKSPWTKCVNLHLGRAYDVMSAKDYCELMGLPSSVDGKYIKPAYDGDVKEKMLEAGCKALEDAFSVLKAKNVFNIFNSDSNKIEAFKPANADQYSQAQCAIVIERVFSELYKYLQFKSTTGEKFQRHINIDSGYKYLTTESILKSDNTNSHAYYDEGDEVPYIRYLLKLRQYLDSDGILSPDEREILGKFIKILEMKNYAWLEMNWSLCPLCQTQPFHSRETWSGREPDESDYTPRYINVEFNLSPQMTWESSSLDTSEQVMCDSNGRPTHIGYATTSDDFAFDLSKIVVLNGPKYAMQDGTNVEFRLVGFSTDANSRTIAYSTDDVITEHDFTEQRNTITLYAIWQSQCIVKFNPGDASGVDGQIQMRPQMVYSGVPTRIQRCGYKPIGAELLVFNYHDGPDWENVEQLNQNGKKIGEYEFSHWEYTVNGRVLRVPDNGMIQLEDGDFSDIPVVELEAKWRKAVGDVIQFKIGGQTYCDFSIQSNARKLEYPQSPVISTTGRRFIGWDRMNGDFMDYSNEAVVNALVVDVQTRTFNVAFNYLSDDGSQTSSNYDVGMDDVVPQFHIQQEVVKDGMRMKFRYWRISSGNLTSSLTAASDVVFEAVYDEVKDKPQPPPENVVDEFKVQLLEIGDFKQMDAPTITDCPYWSNHDERGEVNADNHYYCTLSGLSPKEGIQEIRKCPFMDMFNPSTPERNDFDVATMIEIDDVANLLAALLKINIDIAHKEHFLKIDLPETTDYWYGYEAGGKWISFEPTVEFKFSNLHAANQIVEDRLICTTKDRQDTPRIVSVNRELMEDEGGVQYNDFHYCYDYKEQLNAIKGADNEQNILPTLDESQSYYNIEPLHLYGNSTVQSPVDINHHLRYKMDVIGRSPKQVRTFTSIVKKYRPIVMPDVRDIFNDCVNDKTKYEVDVDNDYGVFGWCTIPSKTMVNMEYNERAIIVPSSYDHHNRVGGSNFLQMDCDLRNIYMKWIDQNPDQEIIPRVGHLEENASRTWYYLYNTRDWTYFLKPFFNIKRNSDIYGYMLDTYGVDQDNHAIDHRPQNSNHLNGVIFEPSNQGRSTDTTFGDIARTCEFLAKYHHGLGNMTTLAERWTNLMSYEKFRSLTQNGEDEFNSMYGSEYQNLPSDYVFPFQDWVDDYNKTGSYIGDDYKYNLGQSHAIDDFDEDSVWFYITMVEPIEDLNQVIELEDIMPFVFWWDNRGEQNNGPTVDCYGLKSNAKLNYEEGGYCYSGPLEREGTTIDSSDSFKDKPTGEIVVEQKWHAVAHTLGVDFSDKRYGNAIVTTDNSGNVRKGAFDPNCIGTEEKWKIHHTSNSFGAYQHEDPTADKYHLGEYAHGEGEFPAKVVPDQFNEDVLESVHDRPMTWNLWNVVRHYVYLKWFKNKDVSVGDERVVWQDIESRTKKIVKSIYRTFQQSKRVMREDDTRRRSMFGDKELDDSTTNSGETCLVHWTNSFAQIQSILERNDRRHDASLVLFTGDVNQNEDGFSNQAMAEWNRIYPGFAQYGDIAVKRHVYDSMKYSECCNFRVTTLDGVDGEKDGMRPRKWSGEMGKWIPSDEFASEDVSVYQGFKFDELPPTYIIGDSLVYKQNLSDTTIHLSDVFDFNKEYPESEYHLDDKMQKWIRRIRQTVMNNQIFPIYTSMEGMEKSHHDLTLKDMKSITFQIAPQLYWRYDWSYNEFMIHRVGKLDSPSKNLRLWDMLGNVWELVRDDWIDNIRPEGHSHDNPPIQNPIHASSGTTFKTIKGGAFDQLIRKVISPSREKIQADSSRSRNATQSNVGFRPSMVFTSENEVGGWDRGQPIDLFFLFDASASQDNQIGEMIESAEEIVKYFAGDQENKTACNVGSALFLGPQVRMMCSQLDKKNEHTYKMFVRIPRYGPDGTNYCRDASSYSSQQKHIAEYDAANAAAEFHSVEDFIEKYKSQLNADRMAYQKNTKVSQTRGMMKSLMTRDSGGWHTGTGEGGGEAAEYPYWTWDYVDMHLYNHHGVPAWMDENESLHFGTGTNKYHLFTYDPREEASSYYEFPFVQSKKGVLCNVFCGCEPVAHIVSKLLGSGCFYGHPWTPGIGYMFRDNSIPKLVFVYANEYDNEIPDTSTGESIVVAPGVNGKNVTFGRCVVKSTGLDGKSVNVPTPPDPHSLQQLKCAEQDVPQLIEGITDFVDAIGFHPYVGELIPSVEHLVGQCRFHAIANYVVSASNKNSNITSFTKTEPPTHVTSVDSGDDLQRRIPEDVFSNVSKWEDVKKVLTEEQCSELLTNSAFPGMEYASGKPKSIDVAHAMTVGFYELHNTVARTQAPINTYFFSSDANCPVKLDTVVEDGHDEDLFLMSRDYLYFQHLMGTKIPDSLNPTITTNLGGKAELQSNVEALGGIWNEGDVKWTYKTLMLLNLAATYGKYNNNAYGSKVSKQGVKNMNVVLGLENPHKKNTIVWGIRNTGIRVLFEDKRNAYPKGYNFVVGLPLTTSRNDLTRDKLDKYVFSKTWDQFKNNIWSSKNWVANKNNCRMRLTEENGNLYYVTIDDTLVGSTMTAEAWEKCRQRVQANRWAIIFRTPMTLTSLVSSESVRKDGNTYYDTTFGDWFNKYAFSNNMVYEDAVTITYRRNIGTEDQPVYETTGTMKIIGLTTTVSGLFNHLAFGPLEGCQITRQTTFWSDIMKVLLDKNDDSYPGMWKRAIAEYAKEEYEKAISWTSPVRLGEIAQPAQTIWSDPTIYQFVKQMYDSMKVASPLLMSYRYYTQMFKNMKNNCGENGNQVTDYDDDENVTIFKPLPIMQFSNMADVFKVSFGSGQFNNTGFSYDHCVVDLNPDYDEYNADVEKDRLRLQDGKFPMTFQHVGDVNQDEYKTSKIVLQRVGEFSGEKSAQFEMGSHSSDYDKVEDPLKLKHRDSESIVSQSKDDYAVVKLWNGGSFQKNQDFYDIVDPEDDRAIPDDKKRKKYRKNKHFFIDPFQLTIAQWCYVHEYQKGDGGCEMDNARVNLENELGPGNFRKMEESYWKYIRTWEPDEWEHMKANGVEVDGIVQFMDAEDDDLAIRELVNLKAYNPLTDTRPYYHATYDNTRGGNILFDESPSYARQYSITSNGDEHQMVEEEENNIPLRQSFMDILNSKVAFQTQKRVYGWRSQGDDGYNINPDGDIEAQVNGYVQRADDPTDGGARLLKNLMDARDAAYGLDKKERAKVWCSGVVGGINFDLPTEAQWEYCCRDGDPAAFPVDNNLGQNFEERNNSLDLIAWYKYKVIGSLPEPERFCAWRVQKFLFGISKDKEQVNNVYENV